MSDERIPGVEERRAAALRVVDRLRKAGHQALFAGGCVRAHLMGRAPKDFDVATSAKPDDVDKLFRRTLEVGRAFGVVIVVEKGVNVEVTTFRSDGPYVDGRHPVSVTFADLQTDAFRRDFTINAMYYDPVSDSITDLVGGRADIDAKLIRTVGDPRRRFDEDKLRMLRAVRFAAELDFTIDPATEAAIRDGAAGLSQVSGERVRMELERMLVTPRASEAVDRMHRLGLLERFLPEVRPMVDCPQPPEYHPEGDVYTHTILALKELTRYWFEPNHPLRMPDAHVQPRFEVALATLLHDVAKPATITYAERIRFDGHDARGAAMTRDIAKRLRLSRAQSEEISWLVARHLQFKDVPQMRTATLKRLLSHKHFAALEQVYIADTMASVKDLSTFRLIQGRKRDFAREALKPKPLLRGKDLIDRGYKPGPGFTTILAEAYDAQLEGALKTTDDAFAWLLARHPLPPRS